MWDEHGEYANDMMAAGLHSMLTNPAQLWFGLAGFGDPDKYKLEDRQYLADLAQVLHGGLRDPKSRFDLSAVQHYTSLGAFGNAATLGVNRVTKVPLWATKPIQRVWWAADADDEIDLGDLSRPADHARGVQALGQPGGQARSRRDGQQERAVPVLSFPVRLLRTPVRHLRSHQADPQAQAVGICVGQRRRKELVHEGGFDTNPWAISRWERRPDEEYGRGCGSKALASVRLLQRSMRATMRGAEKTADPPYQIPDDGVQTPIVLNPSGVNVVRADMFQWQGGGIRPIQSGARPDLSEEFSEQIRQRISRFFMSDLLQLAQDPRMSASQFLGLRAEQMRTFSPTYGRLESDWLCRVVERQLAMYVNNGWIPQPTEGLAQQPIKPTFQSPSVQMMRMQESEAVVRHIEAMAPIIQVDPSVLQNQDMDLTFRRVGQNIGVDPDLFRPQEDVDAQRQEQAELAAAREEREAAKDAGVAAKQMAQAAAAVGGEDALGGGLDLNALLSGNATEIDEPDDEDAVTQGEDEAALAEFEAAA